jgi:putative transposase
MKYEFIKEHHSEFLVKEMCQVLQVSKSGYYHWKQRRKSKRIQENEFLLDEIKQIYNESRLLYGSPKITVELKKKKIKCSRPRVARIMKNNGIKSITKRKFVVTTDSKQNKRIAPNLVGQNFTASAPNKLWLSDITYIKTLNGWLYLAVVLDVYSRKIVGWSMSRNMKSSLVVNALQDALNNRTPSENLVFHSDRGKQYGSNEFVKLLKKHSIIQSMSAAGNCYDNAMMESFFSLLKKELIYINQYNTAYKIRNKIFEYIEIFYNRKRIHSGIDYSNPVDYENSFR